MVLFTREMTHTHAHTLVHTHAHSYTRTHTHSYTHNTHTLIMGRFLQVVSGCADGFVRVHSREGKLLAEHNCTAAGIIDGKVFRESAPLVEDSSPATAERGGCWRYELHCTLQFAASLVAASLLLLLLPFAHPWFPHHISCLVHRVSVACDKAVALLQVDVSSHSSDSNPVCITELWKTQCERQRTGSCHPICLALARFALRARSPTCIYSHVFVCAQLNTLLQWPHPFRSLAAWHARFWTRAFAFSLSVMVGLNGESEVVIKC